MNLGYASKELQNDKDVVMTAVSTSAMDLFYASEELKNDKDIVLIAVAKDGLALCYASDNLQENKELLLLLEGSKQAMHFFPEWYEERMKILECYRIQSKIDNSIVSKTNFKKF